MSYEDKSEHTTAEAPPGSPATKGSGRECVTHHYACDCREHAFVAALAVAQHVMEAWASSEELAQWHHKVDDLLGTAYPARLAPNNADERTAGPRP